MSDKISIVVPCKNEEECVDLFYDEIVKVFAAMPVEYELVFVDDGSTDKTLELFRALAKKDSGVKYVSLSRNFGKEGAMYAGLKHTTGDFVGIMDVDLQDPPALLPEMYQTLKEGAYDCVGSRRVTRKGEPPVRSFFARKFYKLINKMSDTEIVDGARDFRLMTRKMTDAVLSLSEVDRFSKGLFSWVGFKTKWLEYENVERVAGQTKWSFKKLAKYAVGGIEDFATTPLKVNFFLSLLTFLAAIATLVVFICLSVNSRAVTKYFWLVSTFVFLAASFILFGLGVACEYIAKIFRQAKNRPIYIEKETEKDLPADNKN
jgi:glycosyltransferase involved in cell wall biosynthesis